MKLTYSKMGNTAWLYDIKHRTHDTKQGNLTVTAYYKAMTQLSQEMDLYQDQDWKCTEESVMYKQIFEEDLIFDFLVSLNAELDQDRGQLGTILLPSPREVYATIRRE